MGLGEVMYIIIKRIIDLFLALIMLIILSPLMLLIYILVLFELGYPAIFMQKRVGKYEKIFTIYKFKTMYSKVDMFESDSDRVSKIGKILRNTSLDELPQLFNVLKGEMSFIGPRPLLVKYIPFYSRVERKRHSVLPGITGLAQARGRNLLTWEEKFELDVKYVDEFCLLTDVHIFFSTILKVLKRSGIDSTHNVTMPEFTGSKYNKLLIIGASGHGKVVASIAKKLDRWVTINFLDDNIDLDEVLECKVIGKSDEYIKYINDYQIFVAIGNNHIRSKILLDLENLGADIPTIIHPYSIIDDTVLIGKGSVIMGGVVINCDVRIGDGCIINTCASIDHESIISDYVHLSPGAKLAGSVKVEKLTWLGIGSVVVNNVNITNDCIIGAGGVVIRDIKKTGTYVGVPVKKIK